MRRSLFAGWALFLILPLVFQCDAKASALQRQGNTTLQLPPGPPSQGYTTERFYPGNPNFVNPLAFATPPGETSRLFIVEMPGRISVMTDLDERVPTTFLDLTDRVRYSGQTEEGLLGLAFHPGYATNGYFFVFYNATVSGVRHDRLSRFQVSPDNPNQGDSGSELVLISQPDDASNHNAGDIHFGPDGYLYVSLGDEGDADGSLGNTQLINKDFFSGILRIDVDKRPGNLPPNPHPASSSNYSVPADNPFVGATSFNGISVDPNAVRTEFWAVGLRNPWRMSFDPPTGRLYVGDVGQNVREEVDIIEKGGNYGWNFREGKIAGPGARPAEANPIDPIYDYGRSDGAAIIGGMVYRGKNLSQLYGAYLFGDYISGNIWALRDRGANQFDVERLMVDQGISGFGIDPRNGDILIADLDEDRIKRLIYNGDSTGSPLPPLLSDTGAFSDLAALTPNPGIVPYQLNVPFWSDGAQKTRWFSIPDASQTIGFDANGNWSFPAGMVWIKHFEIPSANGTSRRLETRFLVRNANGVYGITYRWDDSQTNATLVPEEGMDEPIAVNDGGIIRTQIWHYPSRSECLICHTPVAGYGLGFRTAQLNRDVDYGSGAVNQIQALSDAGYFGTHVTGINTLPALAHATNETVSTEFRVRSYLMANCSQCHQPGGAGLGLFDTRITTPTAAAGLVNGPLNNYQGDADSRVFKPGAPEHSMLLRRISSLGSDRMPPLATSVLDTNAISLLTAWIANDLPKFQTFEDWQQAHFESTTDPNSGPDADPDGDGNSNYLEFLTEHDPLANADFWNLSIQRSGSGISILFPQIANRKFEVQSTTDLLTPSLWQSLDTPSNRPFFSSTNSTGIVEDSLLDTQSKFYRVRISEP